MDFHLTQQMYAVYPAQVQQQQFQQVYHQQHGVAYAPEVVQDQYNLRMPYANYYYEALPTYSAEPYLPGPPLAEHEMMQPAPVVHAPVPILLGPQFGDGSCFSSDGSETGGEVVNRPGYYASVDYPAAPICGNIANAPQGQGSWFGHREPSVPVTQTSTFPTPSELLVELAANDDSNTMRGPIVSAAASPAYSASPEPSDNPHLEQDAENPRSARPMSRSSSVSILPETATVNDTISSHEKKRYYLECLEQYVMYLHDQFNLLGANPVPLRRVETYRGLDSRSIRTLLVHMEGNNKKLEDKTVAEERRFLALRDEVLRKDMANSVN